MARHWKLKKKSHHHPGNANPATIVPRLSSPISLKRPDHVFKSLKNLNGLLQNSTLGSFLKQGLLFCSNKIEKRRTLDYPFGIEIEIGIFHSSIPNLSSMPIAIPIFRAPANIQHHENIDKRFHENIGSPAEVRIRKIEMSFLWTSPKSEH